MLVIHSNKCKFQAINCPKIPVRRGLTMNTNETKMSVRVQLSCANGNSLIGASELVCLPSGNWSAPLPVCESNFVMKYLSIIRETKREKNSCISQVLNAEICQ